MVYKARRGNVNLKEDRKAVAWNSVWGKLNETGGLLNKIVKSQKSIGQETWEADSTLRKKMKNMRSYL